MEQVKGRITKTQVFEIPDLSVKVTEHHIHEIKCPYCQTICRPFVPKEISAPVQYGPRFKSLLIYLHNYHFVSAQRVQEFCQDVFGHTLSQSSLFEAEKLAAKNLQSFERILREKLKTSFVLHADETALRVNKQLFWLHVASTKTQPCFLPIQEEATRQWLKWIYYLTLKAFLFTIIMLLTLNSIVSTLFATLII